MTPTELIEQIEQGPPPINRTNPIAALEWWEHMGPLLAVELKKLLPVKCSERMPTEKDGKWFIVQHETIEDRLMIRDAEDVEDLYEQGFCTHWSRIPQIGSEEK